MVKPKKMEKKPVTDEEAPEQEFVVEQAPEEGTAEEESEEEW